jgi:hypothetical protein
MIHRIINQKVQKFVIKLSHWRNVLRAMATSTMIYCLVSERELLRKPGFRDGYFFLG